MTPELGSTVRQRRLLPVVALALLVGSVRAAAELVFACSLGAKQVSVVREGANWVYRFGRPGQVELTIVGSIAKNNLFFRAELYSAMVYQLRFTKGACSYIVYSLPPNPVAGAAGVSGLIVLNNLKKVSDVFCKKWSPLIYSTASLIPEDSDIYFAMMPGYRSPLFAGKHSSVTRSSLAL